MNDKEQGATCGIIKIYVINNMKFDLEENNIVKSTEKGNTIVPSENPIKDESKILGENPKEIPVYNNVKDKDIVD